MFANLRNFSLIPNKNSRKIAGNIIKKDKRPREGSFFSEAFLVLCLTCITIQAYVLPIIEWHLAVDGKCLSPGRCTPVPTNRQKLALSIYFQYLHHLYIFKASGPFLTLICQGREFHTSYSCILPAVDCITSISNFFGFYIEIVIDNRNNVFSVFNSIKGSIQTKIKKLHNIIVTIISSTKWWCNIYHSALSVPIH